MSRPGRLTRAEQRLFSERFFGKRLPQTAVRESGALPQPIRNLRFLRTAKPADKATRRRKKLVLERLEFALDDPLGDARHVREFAVDDAGHLALDVGDGDAVLGDK